MFILKLLTAAFSLRRCGVRFGVERCRSVVLGCFSFGRNVLGDQIYAAARGIRIFDTAVDRNFANIVKRIKRGGYDKILKRVDKLIKEIGAEGVAMLRQSDLITKFHRKNIDLLDRSGQIIFRGSPEEMVYFLVNKVEPPHRVRELFQAVVNAKNKFNPNSPALVAKGIRLARSRRGLCPDFRKSVQYLYRGQKRFGNIKIKLTGSRGVDFKLARKEAGLRRTPKGYTWHHLDDFDPITGECTMQLVKTTIHDAASHTGGSSLWSTFYSINYK
jgi:hypothetical protein